MPVVLGLAVMDELHPLSDLEVVDGIDSHVSLAGVSSSDLVNRCL